jgi:glycosyltransferase involved in cell wall biosynthesis
LSSLEAASMDCALVVSRNGDTEEYFGKHAAYCEPASPDSIGAAIQRARAAGPSAELRSRIADELTWTRAAELTLQGYHRALTGGSRGAGGP